MNEEALGTQPQEETRSGWGATCLKLTGCGCLVALLLTIFGVWLVDRWIPVLGHDWNMGERMHVRSGQVLEDSIFFLGQEFKVDGEIDGDVTMLGEGLEVAGTIRGDVVFMGERLHLSGPPTVGTIDGDLRFMGEHCRIEGRVTGDVNFTGERLTLGPEGVIEGDVEMTGETFENEGTVGGSISGVDNN